MQPIDCNHHILHEIVNGKSLVAQKFLKQFSL